MANKTLVLAEKPSQGRELARVLNCRQKGKGYFEGNNYIVTWALGHLVTLATPDEYDKKYKKWQMEHLPIIPKEFKLVIIPSTRHQFRLISQLMKRQDVKDLVIATDAGREGELVARWIMEKAGWRKETKRLWISSQTDAAVKEGFAKLKSAQEYDNLYAAAKGRSISDWLVGFNISRALTCKYHASLSAGRVQTPTLAIIAGREEEIEKFKPQTYFTLSALFSGFKAQHRPKGGRRLNALEEAENLQKKCQRERSALVKSAVKSNKRELPPLLFDLTELQREANRIYSFSAKKTLDLTQRLYEEHKLLTYPRTDSKYLSSDLVATIPARLKSLNHSPTYGKIAQALLNQPLRNNKRIFNDEKVSDHYAIIPTEERANYLALTQDERSIYELVVARFLAAFSPDFLYEQLDLTLEIAGEEFTAKGKAIKSLGWRNLLNLDREDEDEEDQEQVLPAIKDGQSIPLQDVQLNRRQTQAPKRYTEATLLSAMENPSRFVEDKNLRSVLQEAKGIGTPATRAEIIERLISANYVERRGKEFFPLSKGRQLLELVPEDLKSPALTAVWEEKLNSIAQGKLSEKAFLKEIIDYTKDLVKTVRTTQGTYRHDNLTGNRCPNCNQFMLEINGKRGKMLVCSDRECGFRQNLSYLSNARCPVCHKKLEVVGEGDKRLYTCSCGFRERFDRFNQELAKKRNQAGRADVIRYQKEQAKREKEESVSAFELAFKKAQKKK